MTTENKLTGKEIYHLITELAHKLEASYIPFLISVSIKGEERTKCGLLYGATIEDALRSMAMGLTQLYIAEFSQTRTLIEFTGMIVDAIFQYYDLQDEKIFVETEL